MLVKSAFPLSFVTYVLRTPRELFEIKIVDRKEIVCVCVCVLSKTFDR